MPFIQSAETPSAKLHVSEVKSPILIGVLVLAGIVVVLFAFNVASAAQGLSFQLEENSSAEALTNAKEATSLDEGEIRGDTKSASGTSTFTSKDENTDTASDIYVFVSGEVENPGVYVFHEGARAVEAIEAAGGFLESAATDYNNLAAPLQDGMQIYVPSKDQLEQNANEAAISPTYREVGTPNFSNSDTGLVNINTASQSELEQLPGVGPATASKIIASREQQGPFSSIEDLMRVSGIGEKKLEALKDMVCV